MENELIVIGKITGVHGIGGKVRVVSYAESPATFVSQDYLYLKDQRGTVKKYGLAQAKPHKNVLLLIFNGITSLDEAVKLVGSSLLIEKRKLGLLHEGEYYWDDIIGLEVFTDNGEFLGIVEEILQTGSNDVYVVRKDDREYLVPAISSVVLKIDVNENMMVVHPIEGLFENVAV